MKAKLIIDIYFEAKLELSVPLFYLTPSKYIHHLNNNQYKVWTKHKR